MEQTKGDALTSEHPAALAAVAAAAVGLNTPIALPMELAVVASVPPHAVPGSIKGPNVHQLVRVSAAHAEGSNSSSGSGSSHASEHKDITSPPPDSPASDKLHSMIQISTQLSPEDTHDTPQPHRPTAPHQTGAPAQKYVEDITDVTAAEDQQQTTPGSRTLPAGGVQGQQAHLDGSRALARDADTWTAHHQQQQQQHMLPQQEIQLASNLMSAAGVPNHQLPPPARHGSTHTEASEPDAAAVTATVSLTKQHSTDLTHVSPGDVTSITPASPQALHVTAAPRCPQLLPPVRRHWLVSYLLIPLVAPVLAAYCLVALVVGLVAPWTVVPCLLLAQRLYWACPFIPHIFRSPAVQGRWGRLGALLLRLQFEGAHCVTVVTRLLTLPLRPHLPDFYIAGFPKCGTTSLAAHLRSHPALSGISGMPGHEALGKESHFFMGLLGRDTTGSRTLYRSFFPTLLTRWWAEVVRGVPRWSCFDACPTYACLPHLPPRIAALTPAAKIILMVREPVSAVFSAETMLRNMGCLLKWSLSQPLQRDPESGEVVDQRFQEDPADAAYWEQLSRLPPGAPLPADLPTRFYFKLHSYLAAARYSRQVRIWLQHFSPDNVLLLDFKEFVLQPERVVRRVLDFVGVEQHRYTYRPMPPGMATSYQGARVDAGVATHLAQTWFADSNAELEELMGAELAWRPGFKG